MNTPAHAVAALEPSLLYPVVLIDDDPDDLFFITRRIKRTGTANPILSFADGAEAVQHFKQFCATSAGQPPACVVFCDIKMPRMGGFEVLRWFRGQEKLAAVRFLMLSGSNELVDRQLAHELGANDYLVKFPTEEQFATVIKAAVANISAAYRRAGK